MLAYLWPPVVQQGVPCNLVISVPQGPGATTGMQQQQFSELGVVLDDEALGCPVLDVQFPIMQPAGTQSIKVLVDPREIGTGHIQLRLAGWQAGGGASTAASLENGAPCSTPPSAVRKLPIICLPLEAACEVTALFDALVKTRLSEEQQGCLSGSSSCTSSKPNQQQQLDVDAQHRLVAQVHQEHINPICSDLATILRDPLSPFHRLKPACDRLVPKLLAHGMSHCHAVVRGWLALMEDEAGGGGNSSEGGPAAAGCLNMVEFLSQARVEGTSQTLGQAMNADLYSYSSTGSLAPSFDEDLEPNLEGYWANLPDSPVSSFPSAFISVQQQQQQQQPQLQKQQTSISGASSANDDFVLTSFAPEQDQSCSPHLLAGIALNHAASAGLCTDEDDGLVSMGPVQRHVPCHSEGTPLVLGEPTLSSHPSPVHHHLKRTCSNYSTASSPPAPEQPTPTPSTPTPFVQLRTSPFSVLLSGFKGCCEDGSALFAAGVWSAEEREYHDGYEHRFSRCWAARHQGVDASALVLTLALILALLPGSLMVEGQQQRRTSLGLLLLQAIPMLLFGVMLVSKQQGMGKHRDRITVLSRAVNAALLAGFCVMPQGQAMPALLLRLAHTPLLLRAAIVVFQNAYRAVLLKNVMLVSLVECLALGWVSVCAGAALLPTLVHAISLWVVAVLTSAMLDASSRRSFSRAMLRGLNPGAVLAHPHSLKGELVHHGDGKGELQPAGHLFGASPLRRRGSTGTSMHPVCLY
uniref:Uncharacterized protein n=1 Tax=Dunaliella tertiolecta TaxID=3047 RepID=A0A7S3VIX0_DUNTE|mmetsp:Transcript_28264/g.76328  ORF Transcript_28264/g.76328 Transcript_28264/m.76328 type:complete len:750 (-) Transcript_28264:1286-3535(-)|eukprot:CAMPEP_0202357430 /NCGR_PEP_ID=MMETSP1126-20121109/11460_1 /ASSEMBLY_ACC=CAM_ASM_000457 /TAXON_ID=3047 /ORGANISM="Dunaliella tertiolecta, Strain CCMP1320" /LENGTH=749 /DNA_ID=CAMNT_0048950309 /DNA_START=79 /DNA_END=2328 /DNA_ORIENTATION=+